jgi:tetratricopeptide (TPR) repeat protein
MRAVTTCALVLALAVCALYWPVRTFEFVNYDDHRYITHNPRVQQGLTADNIAWALTTFEVANWHPLTWLSHMLDVSVFGGEGQAAGWHHLVNVALHALNGALLLIVLHRMTGALWRSALAASLFALHPLRVESVAWVSERKDVLSAMFGLLAILAYSRFVRTAPPRDRRSQSFAAYLLVALCMALSLMCKPMLVTMPALLLLLDLWPLERIRTNSFGRDLLRAGIEKLPLLALSVASAAITVIAQRSGGAVADTQFVPLPARIENAIVACAIYLQQTFWPAGLAPFYPHPGAQGWPILTVIGAATALLAISVVCAILWRRGRRAPLIGWLWYLGALVPVIGLVQVGMQAHADRYTYLPSIGLGMMLAWSLPTLRARPVRIVQASVACACLVGLALATRYQFMFWRDSVVLSQRAIAVTRDNAVAHFNLSNALVERDRINEAREQLRAAETIDPQWADVQYNLGNIALRSDDLIEAERRYQEALHLRPDFALAFNNLGLICTRTGRMPAAIAYFRQAVASAPDLVDARLNLASALLTAGGEEELRESIDHLRAVVEIVPNDSVVQWRLGVALLRFNRPIEAEAALAKAVALDPTSPQPRVALAEALLAQGKRDLALAHLQQAWDFARQFGDSALQAEIARRIQSLPPAGMER